MLEIKAGLPFSSHMEELAVQSLSQLYYFTIIRLDWEVMFWP